MPGFWLGAKRLIATRIFEGMRAAESLGKLFPGQSAKKVTCVDAVGDIDE